MDLLADYKDKMQPIKDIIGAAFDSVNWYKKGMHEDIYEVGMRIELEEKGYLVHQQEEFPVYYKGKVTSKVFRLDLAIDTPRIGTVIIELKAINRIEDKQRHQLWSYMRLTNTKYGVLINFSPSGVYSELYEYDSVTNSCHPFKLMA